jgi:quercetin dioxygenase-like cupin family protein
MAEKQLIKNIEFSQALDLENLVEYQDGQVSSRTFAQNKSMSLTLFAFAEGEGLSTHSASGDAFVHVLDGTATLTIGGEEVTAKRGEVVVMPASIPHSVDAKERFKMLLIVVREGD